MATEELESNLKQEIENQDNIVNRQVNVYENDGYIEVEVIYEVLETIGNKERILF